MGDHQATIGIDDISITSGSCVAAKDNTFQCQPTNQTIPKSKQCDGNKDCANGADELDCGSCAFRDADVCNFHESVPS